MKTYFCSHTGDICQTVAGMVVADDKKDAADRVNKRLNTDLVGKVRPDQFQEFTGYYGQVVILNDGEY